MKLSQFRKQDIMKILLAAGIIVAAVIIALLIVFKTVSPKISTSIDNVKEKRIQREQESETDENEQITTDANTSDQTDIVESSSENAARGLINDILLQDGLYYNPSTNADYSASLDTEQYYEYTDEGGYFTFSYPITLYNSVEVNREPESVAGGENVISVSMCGTDGSNAFFQKIDVLGNLENLYSVIADQFYDTEVIKHDENSVFILSGYQDSSEQIAIYYLARRYDNYIYIMRIDFPYNGDSGSEDYMQKCYVVENFYRMCGFGGSSYRPRTYEQYKAGDMGEKY